MVGRKGRDVKSASRGGPGRWGWRVLAALLLVIPLVTALGGRGAVAQDDVAPLRIGTLFPFTGDLSDFGPAFWNAAELAANQINAGGGVNGKPIELVRADTATSPQQAVEEARRLVDVEGVPAMIGPAGSGEALPVAESIAGPSHVLVISPSATSPALSIANDDDFFFRTTISDAAQGVVMADLAHEQGYTTACVFYLNNAYGQGLSDAFAKQFTSDGGTVTAQVPHEGEQASYASELATCTADNPDVMIAISYPESGRIFLRELVESGNVPALIFSDGLKSSDLFQELGWEQFEGDYGTAPGSAETEIGKAFDQAWQEAYGALPSYPYLRETYDAVYVIALAAQQAHSVDATGIRDALRGVANAPGTVVTPGTEGWKKAVAALDAGEDIDYEGAVGPLNFDQNGDVDKGTIVIWQIKNGEIVTAETREIDLSGAAPSGTPAATPAA
ncbi:MAG TPA: ABC transporter substrate-binding protein [Thermomicrobiales bacterium]|nr:ABC transporter substrate-binding protein [Thermomicrobiales bacterium]